MFFFFSFIEEKKKQKEELLLKSWVFRDLRIAARAPPLDPANFLEKSLIKNSWSVTFSLNMRLFMNPKKLLFFLPPLCGALTALFYLLSLRSDFEFVIGHFAADSVPFLFCKIFVWAGILLAAAVIPASYRTVAADLPALSPVGACASLVAAAAAVYASGRSIGAYASSSTHDRAAILSLFAALFGLILAASLVLSVFRGTRHGAPASVCAVLGALSVNLSMFACYFDFSIPLNSPVRSLTILAQSGALLFLLSEARLRAYPTAEKTSAAFTLLSATAAASVTLGVALGGLIHRLLPVIGTPEPNLPVSHLIFYCAVGLLAAERLATWSGSLRRLSKEEFARRKAQEKENAKKKEKE